MYTFVTFAEGRGNILVGGMWVSLISFIILIHFEQKLGEGIVLVIIARREKQDHTHT